MKPLPLSFFEEKSRKKLDIFNQFYAKLAKIKMGFMAKTLEYIIYIGSLVLVQFEANFFYELSSF